MKRIIFSALIILAFAGCKKDDDVELPKPPTANAGPDQTVTLPATVSFTGSGTTQNGFIKGYLWSLISGPNNPVITSPSSKNTTVTNLVAGAYLFQFMVVDNAGLTGIDTVGVTVTNAPVQTITLQPANNPDERHVLGNGSTINQGDSPGEFSGTAWTTGGVTVFIRGLFRFDFNIPANATILSAKLSLYSNPTPLNGNLVDANFGTNNSIFIRRITTPWNAASTVWSNQPFTTSVNQVSIPHTNQKMLDLIDIDVKSLVEDMRSLGNNGFMLQLQNEVIFNSRNFCSSRYTDATKRPKLVITYQ